MKEIDFLPEWYKSGRKRRINYKRQCAAILGLFLVMVVWSFVSGRTVSRAKAELDEINVINLYGRGLVSKTQLMENEVQELKQQAAVIEKTSSRISVQNILGELGYLIGKGVVMDSIDIIAVPMAVKGAQNQSTGRMVRTAGIGGKEQNEAGDYRFKIQLNGLAADASNVAELVCDMEESPYFCQVRPEFSKDKKTDKYRATEFQITCYVENYTEGQ